MGYRVFVWDTGYGYDGVGVWLYFIVAGFNY